MPEEQYDLFDDENGWVYPSIASIIILFAIVVFVGLSACSSTGDISGTLNSVWNTSVKKEDSPKQAELPKADNLQK